LESAAATAASSYALITRASHQMLDIVNCLLSLQLRNFEPAENLGFSLLEQAGLFLSFFEDFLF